MSKINLRKQITLKVNANFFSGYEALESLGYTELEDKMEQGKHNYKIFEKNGEKFAYRSMDHYNTYIYSIKVSPVVENTNE